MKKIDVASSESVEQWSERMGKSLAERDGTDGVHLPGASSVARKPDVGTDAIADARIQLEELQQQLQREVLHSRMSTEGFIALMRERDRARDRLAAAVRATDSSGGHDLQTAQEPNQQSAVAALKPD